MVISKIESMVMDIEKRVTRIEDAADRLELAVESLRGFKDSVLNKLALLGLLSFLGGGGISVLAIKTFFGGHV